MEQNKHVNQDFNIPVYIFEEIVEYVEQTAEGHFRCMQWENIRRLLRLAVVDERLTIDQAKYLERTYYRED